MALSNRFSNPFPNFFTTNLDFLAGGTLNFYVSSTGARATTWPNAARTGGGNPNPITLDSYGKPPVDIFLDPSVTYRVQLLDAAGASIWTADPYYDPLLQQQAKFQVYAGNPNGFVAGNAGTPGGSPSDVVYDSTDNLVYVCTSTGIAAAAVWTSIAVSSTQAIVVPQGRLTPTTLTPVISSDVTLVAGQAILYTPTEGNLVPIFNGTTTGLYPAAELSLVLNAAAHLATSVYDVYAFLVAGVVTLGSSPAWSQIGAAYYTTGTTLTAGSAASRGTGAGTAQLARYSGNGLWTNAVLMTLKNGATTYANIPANQATYLGSFWTDTANGAVTCHANSFGTGRKFGIWNAYNRRPIILTAGDASASYTYATGTFRAAHNTAANSLTLFQGLAEEWSEVQLQQQFTTNNTFTTQIGIGAGVTNAASGVIWSGTSSAVANATGSARYAAPPLLGLQSMTSLEYANGGTITFYGTQANQELRAVWRG